MLAGALLSKWISNTATSMKMMPVASPNQAIVFGLGYVRIKDMIKAGLWFYFIEIILVSAVFLV